MRLRRVIVATATLGMSLPLAPASAVARAAPFSIAVPDSEVKLEETFTVNGSNACATAPYTVTFTYTKHDGGTATLDASGTTDGDGAFSKDVTVPEAATPDQDASVEASVTCASASQTSTSQPFRARQAGGTTSNTVAITIQVANGVLSTNKAQGRAGTAVHVSGTNCLGNDVVVVFGNNGGAANVAVTLRPDDTFSGDYTIPNVPPGPYFFAASCPGTDYQDRAFVVLVTPGSTPRPLPRPVHFAG
ncbi:MAG: hypothetical protein QOE45_1695 [Frankiaceae bacterium]|nr:hypothetical protein [Frankiaceae bacterium]